MNNAVWRGMTAALLAVCFVVGSAQGEVRGYGNIKDVDRELGAPAGYPEANAIVVFDCCAITVTMDAIERNYHCRIKVLTQAGVEEVGEQSIYYDKDYDKIKKFSAQTITPDGKKIKVEKDAIFDKEVGWRSERTFAFSAVTPGSIVEFEYYIRSERFHYLSPWYFQNSLYTMESVCSVELPNGFTYDARYYNVPYAQQKPTVSERLDVSQVNVAGTAAKIKTYTWTVKDLMPARDEPYMMALDDFRSNLKFKLVAFERGHFHMSYVQTWEEVGSDFLDYHKDYYNCDDEVKRLAAQLTTQADTDLDRSKALFKYVSEGFQTSDDYESRYLHNERMSKLLESRTGTAEEKNLLLTALHRAVGIDAFPVLLGTRDRGRLDASSADSRQFNYLVTYVQLSDHFEFLDASSRYLPYGLIPPDCLASGGLLIDADSSTLVKIMPRVEESARRDVTRLHVTTDGEVEATTYSEMTGLYAADIARRFDRTTPEEYVKERYLERLGIQYMLDSLSAVLDSGATLRVNLAYTSSDLAQLLDDNILVKMVGYAWQENPFPRESRTYPIDFNYPFVYENTVEISSELPVTLFKLPPDSTINLGDAFLKRKSRTTETGAVVSWLLSIRHPEFGVKTYPELRELFVQLALWDDDEAMVVLGETAP